ncbi:hypothetical protein D3C80_2094950 [compost metagenome]
MNRTNKKTTLPPKILRNDNLKNVDQKLRALNRLTVKKKAPKNTTPIAAITLVLLPDKTTRKKDKKSITKYRKLYLNLLLLISDCSV